MDQDWTPVSWDKRGKTTGVSRAEAVNRAARSGTLVTEKKQNAGSNRPQSGAGPNARRIEEETDDFRVAQVGRSLAQAIQQARLAKKMNQKELATAINEKPTIITEYEAGRAIPNGGIIVKLERVLQVSLPRPPKIKKTRPDE